jgi:CheY-like chemotaxis protein
MTRTRILLVEDNALLRDWMRTSLEEEGFDVTAAASVAEAHAAGSGWPFEVLLTDWKLADGSGFDVLAILEPMWSGVIPILISADADAALVERARAAGFRSVLQKPYPPWKVAAAIQELAGPCEVAV